MRRAWAFVMLLAVLAGTASCAVSPPRERSVTLGFESIVDLRADPAALAQRLDDAHANGVALSVGRPEWTAAPWPAHRDEQAGLVTSTGRDFVREALDRVGGGRRVTLVVDLLAPRHIDDNEELAAKDASGKRSAELPSVAALDGDYGDLVVEWVGEVARRYHPDAVSLTELFVEDPSVPEAERVAAVNRLVKRAADAAHGSGAKLYMDVRASSSAPTVGRRDSGQDYQALLGACDGLTVWAYGGLTSSDGSRVDAGTLARSLRKAYGDRVEVSLGLWADQGTVSADSLAKDLSAVAGAGAGRINVTPASLLTDAHWAALKRAWE